MEEEARPKTPTPDDVPNMPEFAPVGPEHFDEVRQFFTRAEWDEMSEWLKHAYTKQRRNYLIFMKLSEYFSLII